jgi:hypothetical protein
MACGTTDVYAAAQAISAEIPEILRNVKDGDEKWFDLGSSSAPNYPYNINLSPLEDVSPKAHLHLSSFWIDPSSVPQHWPDVNGLATNASDVPERTPGDDSEKMDTAIPPGDKGINVDNAQPSSGPPTHSFAPAPPQVSNSVDGHSKEMDSARFVANDGMNIDKEVDAGDTSNRIARDDGSQSGANPASLSPPSRTPPLSSAPAGEEDMDIDKEEVEKNDRPSGPQTRSSKASKCSVLPPNDTSQQTLDKNKKPNYVDSSDSDTSDASSDVVEITRRATPPAKRSKMNKQTASSLVVAANYINNNRAQPMIVGNRYMKIDFIDLTEIEVSQCNHLFHLTLTSTHRGLRLTKVRHWKPQIR